jgi:hypothetical protein
MEKNGFTNVKTGYLSLDFTPDSPYCSALKAEEIINSARESELESVESVLCSLPNHFTESEAEDIISAINKKYDKRLSIYESNTKLWDTEVSLIMLIRGVKM